MKVKLPQNMWQGFEPIEIDIPDNWETTIHGIEADNMPELTKEQIREKINKPYGLKPLRELAVGRKKVCIVFDDISRATPTKVLAEVVLEELHAAGIQKDQISFICALGCHGAHSREEFVNKLGKEIVTNYAIYNHNCYDNLTNIGKSKDGYDVMINNEVMDSDLKIGIGAILPHVFNTFGGGGKIIIPGVAGIDSIQQTHIAAIDFAKKHNITSSATMGDLRVTAMREKIEEVCGMIGEFFKVDCLYNTRAEIVDVYAGDVVEEYYAAIPMASKIYSTKRAENKDVIISNANARSNEATIAYQLASLACGEKGGDIVIIDFTERGQVTHYMFGTFGEKSPGRMYKSEPTRERFVRKIILYMPNYMETDKFSFGEPEKQIVCRTWDEVLAALSDRGAGTTCSVLVDGTMEFFEVDESLIHFEE
ncbi:MAG: DUF2088 domain-containing protein [Lachnospiraceae bacterium]|nr:DUF2088 domain-containing protein [Lachnospiraceae bacterium]MBR6350239.1 DUF2088 domain-containing protein [Lachnospiraceae bacterium]